MGSVIQSSHNGDLLKSKYTAIGWVQKEQTSGKGGGDTMNEAEMEMMQPQAKECQHLQKLEEVRVRFSPRISRRNAAQRAH